MKKSACIIVGGAILALAVFFNHNHNKTPSKPSGTVAFEYQPQLTINRSATPVQK